ncbi:hypothetical protein ACQP0C_36055 [Nocardia sp. CA-129566]|uniref:hypothetical protein n=1 Tax=Nocardia sp. CA-129566 TaxID=3239976 RepID=UPI003D96814B
MIGTALGWSNTALAADTESITVMEIVDNGTATTDQLAAARPGTLPVITRRSPPS